MITLGTQAPQPYQNQPYLTDIGHTLQLVIMSVAMSAIGYLANQSGVVNAVIGSGIRRDLVRDGSLLLFIFDAPERVYTKIVIYAWMGSWAFLGVAVVASLYFGLASRR